MPRTAPSTSASSVTSSTYWPLISAYVSQRTAKASVGSAQVTVSRTGVAPGDAAVEGVGPDGSADGSSATATAREPPTASPATNVAAPKMRRTATRTAALAAGVRRWLG